MGRAETCRTKPLSGAKETTHVKDLKHLNLADLLRFKWKALCFFFDSLHGFEWFDCGRTGLVFALTLRPHRFASCWTPAARRTLWNLTRLNCDMHLVFKTSGNTFRNNANSKAQQFGESKDRNLFRRRRTPSRKPSQDGVWRLPFYSLSPWCGCLFGSVVFFLSGVFLCPSFRFGLRCFSMSPLGLEVALAWVWFFNSNRASWNGKEMQSFLGGCWALPRTSWIILDDVSPLPKNQRTIF